MKNKVKLSHRILGYIIRFLLSLRYKVILSGKEIISDDNVKIFLPNHPALIDPVILCTHIYKYNNISPAISAKYYKNSLFKPLLKLVNAIPIADLSEGERDKDVYLKLLQKAQHEFEKGHHVLFYPSGQLAGGETEKLFNKQGAFRLISELPENVSVIGVRITGLWGSRWSKAKTGKTPDFTRSLIKSLAYLVLCGFFFCPKRKVYFEFVDLTNTLKELSHTNRNTFNLFLEEFYNKKNIGKNF